MKLECWTLWCLGNPQVEILFLSCFEKQCTCAALHVGHFIDQPTVTLGVQFGITFAVREQLQNVHHQVAIPVECVMGAVCLLFDHQKHQSQQQPPPCMVNTYLNVIPREHSTSTFSCGTPARAWLVEGAATSSSGMEASCFFAAGALLSARRFFAMLSSVLLVYL